LKLSSKNPRANIIFLYKAPCASTVVVVGDPHKRHHVPGSITI
jgi:hypothetical protein